MPGRTRGSSCPPLGPADRPRDLYGSLLRTFGITARARGYQPITDPRGGQPKRDAGSVGNNIAKTRIPAGNSGLGYLESTPEHDQSDADH